MKLTQGHEVKLGSTMPPFSKFLEIYSVSMCNFSKITEWIPKFTESFEAEQKNEPETVNSKFTGATLPQVA